METNEVESKGISALEYCSYCFIGIGMAMFYTAGASGFIITAGCIVIGLILLCVARSKG